MLYLLDANALITAHNTWYGLNRVPEFWSWLLFHGNAGTLKIPTEIYTEIEAGNDELADWVKQPDMRAALRSSEVADLGKVQNVLSCYGNPLSEADLITIGQDAFLIAAAVGHNDRTVVTAEVSKATRTGPRRHVPDVCNDRGVQWMHPVDLIHTLDFRTDWAGGA